MRPMERDRKSAASAVVAHVESLILDGHAAPGQPLPSESELSAELGMSRLTVREGIRTLEARRLIEVSQGRRPVVAHPDSRPLRDFFTTAVRRDARGMLDLIEVRIAIEVHAAELAAIHATHADIVALEAALAEMEVTAADPAHADRFNRADIRFHAAVASASGVRMIDFLVESMEAPLQLGRTVSAGAHRHLAGDLRDLVEAHARILGSIRANDGAAAASRMRQHLDATYRDIEAAYVPPAAAQS
jgi:GntR family transcriptional repressor for pyruvate dehydrogenase complex